jgi:hypothetical protein
LPYALLEGGLCVLDVASPPARRTRQATWSDPRLLAGILLILVSLVVGARVVSAADKTQPMHALKRDLPAGHVLTADDVQPLRVRVPASAAEYLPTTKKVEGQVLVREVRKGELLAATALAPKPPAPTRELSVAVKQDHAAAGLIAGSRVDVIASTIKQGDKPVRTWAVAKGVEVIAEPKSTGGFGGSNYRVLLKVPADLVLDVTSAMRTAEIDIVEVPAGDAGDIGDVAKPAGS